MDAKDADMRRAISRRLFVAGFMAAILALSVGCTEKDRHRRLLRRVDTHVQKAMLDPQGAQANGKPFGLLDNANARWEILRAITTALGNEFWEPSRVSQEKLRAVADRLDANNGKDLETLEGCLTIMDLLEDACPTAKDYVWFADIHEAQARGNIPKARK
jgi:hypothetical protein